MTRSELERRFLSIVDRHALPKPKVNSHIRDRRLGRCGFRTIRLTPRSLAYEAEIVADLEAMLPPTRLKTSSASAR